MAFFFAVQYVCSTVPGTSSLTLRQFSQFSFYSGHETSKMYMQAFLASGLWCVHSSDRLVLVFVFNKLTPSSSSARVGCAPVWGLKGLYLISHENLIGWTIPMTIKAKTDSTRIMSATTASLLLHFLCDLTLSTNHKFTLPGPFLLPDSISDCFGFAEIVWASADDQG
jgi:hypothetical protein